MMELWRQERFAIAGWFAFAAFICWPIAFTFQSQLIGDPAIDVWNHAWGYWYVFQHLVQFQLPLQTELLGAPSGGSLYFIDTPGAVFSAPLQLIFGPAAAYNLTLLTRVAIAGYGAQLLARELFGSGKHTILAGIAYASTPFLLCELANGISEVCATGWLVLAFWATARACRTHRWTDFVLLGVFQGLCSNATFYYGLTSAIVIGFWLLIHFILYSQSEKKWPIEPLKGLGFAVMTSIVVMLPFAGLFAYSLGADDRLVLRDSSLNDQLLRHNAVDPFIYITPGQYQSVDLAAEYGEPFIHTGYLRWTIIALCMAAVVRIRPARIPAGLSAISLVLGLGSYLWWQGEWVLLPSGDYLSLPFDWMRQLLPQIAITHPLRLSIAAQALCAVLASGGLKLLLEKSANTSIRDGMLAVASILVVSESFFGSAATWPLPVSDTHISDAYSQADPNRNVLDLPAEAGTSMKTSQYFWNQTKHQRPIPYTPDARLGSTRDLNTFRSFIGSDGIHEDPKAPDESTAIHMRNIYGLIVVHPEIDEALAESYTSAFSPVFGDPSEAVDGRLFWTLEPLSETEKNNTSNEAETAQPYTDLGETPKALVDCNDLDRALLALNDGQPELEAEIMACEQQLSEHCARRLKNPNTAETEVMLCLQSFVAYPHPEDTEALFQLLRRSEESIKTAAAEALQGKALNESESARLERLMRR